MKGLINIKNNDNKFIPQSHRKHLNPLNKYPQRVTKTDKKIVNDLHCKDIKFSVSKKDCKKI